MLSIRSLINDLRDDYPQFNFELSDEFLWSTQKQTIFINPEMEQSHEYTLHELSHALLHHKGYERDIELLKLERDAWDHAKIRIAPHYDIVIDNATIQNNLDTYRYWLHARSTCPECQVNGIQTKQQLYTCISCHHLWRVNEARVCALRRYSLSSIK